MTGLMPFFTFYGGKWRVAPKYPPPLHDAIMEPFAGSAGYSLRYPGRHVWINDIDPIIAGTWGYLVTVSERDILALPDIGEGQTVDDFPLPQEARWLIGWWLNKGSAQPKRAPSSFMLHHPAGAPYWGEGIRRRIASQLEMIRHWRVTQYDYEELPGSWRNATWFIDPPYQTAGKHYRFGTKGVDYPRLARWCEFIASPQCGRSNQVIVCEADDARWLPFKRLADMDGTEGRQKITRARTEMIWYREGT